MVTVTRREMVTEVAVGLGGDGCRADGRRVPETEDGGAVRERLTVSGPARVTAAVTDPAVAHTDVRPTRACGLTDTRRLMDGTCHVRLARACHRSDTLPSHPLPSPPLPDDGLPP